MKNTNLVFVYGTLMEGFGNNQIIQRHSGLKICEGTISGTMYDLGYFPGVRLGGAGLVHGEIWKVNASCMQSLDRLEGEGSLYKRKKVSVTDSDSFQIGMKTTIEDVWVYEIMSKQRLQQLVPSGNWRDRDHSQDRFRL